MAQIERGLLIVPLPSMHKHKHIGTVLPSIRVSISIVALSPRVLHEPRSFLSSFLAILTSLRHGSCRRSLLNLARH
ncbi:hypothetical protein BV22DRAFT_1033202 [Leucogyrophana mollusca]|uniref:Uncharacterized protein n=1 Tax=Leucogyrophana mollusca TaxID=85980 RepID=A0ACB8BJK7_9AGAM|nr:hypothetical protein BV22DRAFT_1033202 [Leucogyrophana mollusca]